MIKSLASGRPMWWHDIKEIQAGVTCLHERLDDAEISYEKILDLEFKINKMEIKLDKFDQCLNNVLKLNAMINEFKGCVAMARSALSEKKQVLKAVNKKKKGAPEKVNPACV